MKKYFFKLFISLSVLILLIYSTDLEELANSFYSINVNAIVYAFCLILVIRIIMALRWKVLLDYYQIRATIIKLVEIMFVSNALGHLLPSGIGADIIRVYELSKNQGSTDKVLASVFLDRVFGLFSMLLVALVAAWYAYFSGQLELMVPLLITSAVLLIPFAFIVTRYTLSKKVRLSSNSEIIVKITEFYNRFITALRRTEIPMYGFFVLILLSVFVQFIRSLVFMFLFIGLGADIAIVSYFIFIPIVFILMLLPISIGGLGVRETALFAFYGPYGLSVATCTVAGLIFHALQLVMIIPGLIIFILRK